LLALLLAGCSGGEEPEPAASPPPPAAGTVTPPPPPPPPAQAQAAGSIVRAWSKALNAGDNERAAALFAPGARIFQSGYVLVLRDHEDAVRWNAALPCSGQIVRLTFRRRVATAEFVLGNRKTSPCDGPGLHAVAEFHIRKGKIVIWRQLPASQPDEPTI
jgi:hypothetical protein